MNHSIHLKITLAVIAGVLVLAAFGVPVLANLPLLAFLLVCPLMMMLMMRGMGHGSSKGDETADAAHRAHKH